MSAAVAPSAKDAARLFSIPAAICVFVALAGFVLNGYAVRPAELAKFDAGRMFALAQGLADTAQVLTEARSSGGQAELDAALARLRQLAADARTLTHVNPTVDVALNAVLRGAQSDSAAANDEIRVQAAVAQRALVRRGQDMLAIAQQQTNTASELYLTLLMVALGIALIGLRWGTRLYGNASTLPPAIVIDDLGQTLISNSSESICVTDRDGVIRQVNAAYSRATGYAQDEIIGQDLEFNLAPRPGAPASSTAAAELFARQAWSGELWRRHKSGEAYVEHTSRALLHDAAGDVAGVVSIAHDLGASRDAQRLLSWHANHDQLTKLPNRTLFLDRLSNLAMHATERGAVMILDIDRFKDVNANYGYAAGDQLLTQFAHRLALAVSDRDTVARLAGDRFGVLLAPPLKAGEAERVTRALLARLRETVLINQHELTLSTSAGLTIFPEDGVDVNALVRQAERALIDCKQDSCDRYRFFANDLNASAVRRAELEHALASAISQQQLQLVYQPIVDVQQQSVYAVEALLRWQHPTLGAISPAEFIPIAEDSGLMTPIGLWVCDAVDAQLDQWLRAGLSELRVTVNISGQQLRTREARDEIARRMTGRHAHRLTLEITESLLLDDRAGIGDFLREVRAAGVQVALDDFGTGYSSLSYLLRFPIDVLKIDKSFVDDMENDNKALQLVASIVSMGRILGLRVVAEGVETEGQVQKLMLCGGELIQGYFFARPMAAEAVVNFVTRSAVQNRLRMTG